MGESPVTMMNMGDDKSGLIFGQGESRNTQSRGGHGTETSIAEHATLVVERSGGSKRKPPRPPSSNLPQPD